MSSYLTYPLDKFAKFPPLIQPKKLRYELFLVKLELQFERNLRTIIVCVRLDGNDSVVARLDMASVAKCKDVMSIGVHGFKVARLRDVKKVSYNFMVQHFQLHLDRVQIFGPSFLFF